MSNPPPSVEETTWRERPAWRFSAPDGLTLIVTRTGGHLAALWASGDTSRLNPLWQPHWAAAPPSAAATSVAWGEGEHAVEAPLLTNICGSNLCLDRFGAPHPGEERPLHGEAGVAEWGVDVSADASTFTVTALLPLARLRVWRSFALLAGGSRVRLTTRALPEGEGARSVEWCEHTTLGGTFLDGCVITAGVDAARVMGGAEEADPAHIDVAEALRLPSPDAPPEGHVRTCRVVEGVWSASNAALGWRLSAAWELSHFPWLCLWTEHRQRMTAPWGGVERTRGMELSTKPFPEGLPHPSRAAAFLGTPTTATVLPGGVERVVELAWERV